MLKMLISRLPVKCFYGDPSRVYLVFRCIFVGISTVRKRVVFEFCF